MNPFRENLGPSARRGCSQEKTTSALREMNKARRAVGVAAFTPLANRYARPLRDPWISDSSFSQRPRTKTDCRKNTSRAISAHPQQQSPAAGKCGRLFEGLANFELKNTLSRWRVALHGCNAIVECRRNAFKNFSGPPKSSKDAVALSRKSENVHFIALINPGTRVASGCPVVRCRKPRKGATKGRGAKTASAPLCLTPQVVIPSLELQLSTLFVTVNSFFRNFGILFGKQVPVSFLTKRVP